MANTLLTNDLITKEALRVLRNKFTLVPRSLRNVDDLFGKTGYKAGDTVRIRIPVRYTSALGAAVHMNDATESQTSITLNQRNIGMSFLSKDRTLSIDAFSARFIEPAMAQLASDIDADGYALYYKSTNITTPGAYTNGAPAAFTGADVSTLKPFLDAKARMFEQAVPGDDKLFVAVHPSTSAGIVDGLKGLFQSADEIGKQYKRGLMGMAAGFQFLESQNLPTHTSGSRTDGAIAGAAQTGSTLVVGGLGAAGTVVKGDTFTIAGVYTINPLTRQATNKLQVFTVTAGTVADGTGTAMLAIAPALNIVAPNQTVSALPADAAVVSWTSGAGVSSAVNFAWHESAMLVAFADLTTDLPGAEASKQTDEDGITLRLVGSYDVNSDETIYRLDVMYGWANVRGQHTCRIQG